MHAPIVIYRQGWRPGSFRPGDQATIVIWPAKDGTHGGFVFSATDAHGRTLTTMKPNL